MIKIDVFCAKNHLMEVKFEKAYGGGAFGANCDVCGWKNIENLDYYYHCKSCGYDMCPRCAFYRCNPPILTEKNIESSLHLHTL